MTTGRTVRAGATLDRPATIVLQTLLVLGALLLGGIGALAVFPAHPTTSTPASARMVPHSPTPFATTYYTVSFVETGLPASTTWSVILTSLRTNSSLSNQTPYNNFTEPNGGYAYYPYAAGYAAAPGSLYVNGSGVTVTVRFSLPWTVTFNESGLRPGTSWSVNVTYSTNFVTRAQSSTTSVSIVLPNGFYTYFVGSVNGYTLAYYSGNFSVNGRNLSINVTFSLAATWYNVSFTESGLPSLTNWSAYFDGYFGGGTTAGGANLSAPITFYQANGSWPYQIPWAGAYEPFPSAGTVLVQGTNVTVSVRFLQQPLYPITFRESGVPTGSNWSLYVSPNSTTNSSYSSSMVAWRANGTHTWFAWIPTSGNSRNASGNVVIAGYGVTVTIAFGTPPPVFGVTFTETGLPSQTNWSVSLNGTTRGSYYNGSIHTAVGFGVPNGSYSYTIPSVGAYAPNPGSGSLRVNGAYVTVAVKFTAPSTFAVQFAESGLPAGTNWSVSINSASRTGSTTNLSVSEPNGSYRWFASATVDGSSVNASGTVNVTGKAAHVSVSFQVPAALFGLTFQESGLGSGANWSVTLTGSSPGLTIELVSGLTRWAGGTATVSFRVSSGSYSYTAASPGHGSVSSTVDVSKTAQIIPVSFAPKGGGPTSNTTSASLPGWAAGIGIIFLLVGGSGLALTTWRYRSRQKLRGQRLVHRISEAQWVPDSNGEPTVRPPR